MDIEEYYDIKRSKSIKKLPYGVVIRDDTINANIMSPETCYALNNGLLKEEDVETYIIVLEEE